MEMDWASPLFLLTLLSSILPIYLLHLIFHKNKNTCYPPGLHPYPIIGHLPQFLRNRHRSHEWLTDLLTASPTNTILFHRPGNIRGLITANPANVEHILKTRFDNYPKGSRSRSNLHDFLGRGIFNSDGHLWRLQRKTASPEFNTRSLRSFVHQTVLHEISSRLLPFLRNSARSAQPIDLQDALERFAFNNICNVAFGIDPSRLDPSSVFAAAFRDASELSAGRFRYALQGLWRIKKALNVGSERRLRDAIAIVHGFATDIIQSKKKDRREDDPDLLSRFVADAENNSDEFLRDIIISFILAGRETTSSALSWFFWLISSRPEVESRILAEAVRIRRDAGGELGLEEVRKLHYLHAAVTEAMRLYPPVPFNSAVCCEDEVLPDGTEIRKGWFMSYNAYAMGRMEGIWGEDCREFRPERWIEEGEFRGESPFKFPAFHGGPRMCLGKEMAYVQMKLVALSVIEGFEREVMIGKDVCPEQVMSLTLRMRGGLPVKVKERRSAGDGGSFTC